MSLNRSDLVLTTRIDGDSFVTRATMFMGASKWRLDMLADLERSGYRVEAQDIPGLWRINGGPELTSNQLVSEARRLLSQRGKP